MLIPLIIGAVLIAAFAVRALCSASPLIDLRLLATRSFGSASGAIFAAGLVMFGLMGILPLYYQVARGYSPQQAGLLLIPMGIAMGLAAAYQRETYPQSFSLACGLLAGAVGRGARERGHPRTCGRT